jgi:hypothetical protein
MGRYSYNTIDKTIKMSTSYSPESEAVPSLPNATPAALSQVFIPRPGFDGHKPSSLIEGEGWLDKAAVSKINNTSVIKCSPTEPETVSQQSQANKHRE